MAVYADLRLGAAFEDFWQSLLAARERAGRPATEGGRASLWRVASAAFEAGWAAGGGGVNPVPITDTPCAGPAGACVAGGGRPG